MGSCDWFCLDAPPLSHTVTQQYRHQPRQPGEGRGEKERREGEKRREAGEREREKRRREEEGREEGGKRGGGEEGEVHTQ